MSIKKGDKQKKTSSEEDDEVEDDNWDEEEDDDDEVILDDMDATDWARVVTDLVDVQQAALAGLLAIRNGWRTVLRGIPTL